MNSHALNLAVTKAVNALATATQGDFVCVMFVTGMKSSTKLDPKAWKKATKCKGVVVVHDAASLDLLRSTGYNATSAAVLAKNNN